MGLTEETEAKYWRTLIVLEKAEHRVALKRLCESLDLSPSKVIGYLIQGFINKHKEKPIE